MIASATTAARRHASQAEARNVIPVVASSTALPTDSARISCTRVKCSTAGMASKTATGIASRAHARGSGGRSSPSRVTRYVIARKSARVPRIRANPIHFQPDWPAIGARSEAGSAWIQEYGIIQPPAVETRSGRSFKGTGRVYGNPRTRS
jgi:hypothetical protein